MDFRQELHIKPWQHTIGLRDSILLLGSCFTEHMAAQLKMHRFRVLENPHGILFNPVSIAKALKDYASAEVYTPQQLFLHNDLYQSWHHHGRFAALHAADALQAIQAEVEQAAAFLPQARWLIVTLGSSFVYELKADSPYNETGVAFTVANCHKVPAAHLHHRMLSYAEVQYWLQQIVLLAQSVNPAVQVVFTVSPVRHAREGIIENNRSKGLLLHAIGELLQQASGVFYFPAYELVIDDLRDYRFYAEDMVHPNYLATRYVWQKFTEACVDKDALGLMESIKVLQLAMTHKPRQPLSAAHQQFRKKMLETARQLKQDAPYLHLEDVIDFFSHD